MSNEEKDLEYATKKVTELSLYICKIQDDIASLVSTHRSDWSWNDVVEDVKKLIEKQKQNKEEIKTTSQPAGAREWAEQIIHDVFPSMDATCAVRYVEQATKHIAAFLAQQTAAKDAELERLTIRVDEERRAWESSERHRKAAERERDSLRAQLKYL